MTLLHGLAIALAFLNTQQVLGASVDTCADQAACFNLAEGPCDEEFGTRDVCINSVPSLAGCNIAEDETLSTACILVSSGGLLIPVNRIDDGTAPMCFALPGGSELLFGFHDDNSATGPDVNPISINHLNTTATASCEVAATNLCSFVAATPLTTFWKYETSRCECQCGNWTEWSACNSTCQRSRSRTCEGAFDFQCPDEVETEMCQAGDGECEECSCTYTEWSECRHHHGSNGSSGSGGGSGGSEGSGGSGGSGGSRGRGHRWRRCRRRRQTRTRTCTVVIEGATCPADEVEKRPCRRRGRRGCRRWFW